MDKIQLFSDIDTMVARQRGREAARTLGFVMVDQTRIALSISELAWNILRYAEAGYMEISVIDGEMRGLKMRAVDFGPGISDVELALTVGYSTSGGLGMGLPSVKSMMDEFTIETELGHGTIVTVHKWLDNLRQFKEN